MATVSVQKSSLNVLTNSPPTLSAANVGGTASYTMPAGNYMIISYLYIGSGTSTTGNVYIDFTNGGPSIAAFSASSSIILTTPIYVGPGAVITFQNNTSGAGTRGLVVGGAIFNNT